MPLAAVLILAAALRVAATPYPQTAAPRAETLAQAHDLLERGDAGAAEAALRRLLLADQGDIEALAGWARALLAQGRGQAALASLVQEAQIRVDASRFEEAARLLELALEIDPTSAGLSGRLGRCYLLDGSFVAAERHLRRALELGPRTLEILLPLAAVLWENGRFDEAESLYREAVQRVPGSADAHDQLGHFLLWRSRFEEASTELERAADLGAAGFGLELDRGRALAGWARELQSDGQGTPQGVAVLERARGAFERAVEAAPEHAEARYGLAQVLLQLGAPEAAEEQLAAYRRLYEEDQARTRAAQRALAQVASGLRLLQEGRAEEARALLEPLPETPDSLRALALVNRQLGRVDAARAALERALTLAPERADLRVLLDELPRQKAADGAR